MRALLYLAAGLGLMLAAASAQDLPEEERPPAEQADRLMRDHCKQIWALQSIDAVNQNENELKKKFDGTQRKLDALLRYHQAQFDELSNRRSRAENDGLIEFLQSAEDIAKAAKRSGDGSKPGAADEDKAIQAALARGNTLEEDIEKARHNLNVDKAFVAAFRTLRNAVATCTTMQRERLQTGAASSGTDGGASGGETSSLSGSVAGTYLFDKCFGDGESWVKSSGFLLRIVRPYSETGENRTGALGGMVMFRGRQLPIERGDLYGDGTFSVNVTYTDFDRRVRGHNMAHGKIARAADGKLTLSGARIGANNFSGSGLCNGPLSQ